MATEYKLSFLANELSFAGSATTSEEGLTGAVAEAFFWLICQVVTADTDRLAEYGASWPVRNHRWACLSAENRLRSRGFLNVFRRNSWRTRE